jgi:limonene-1,2-epoxide hydrolase
MCRLRSGLGWVGWPIHIYGEADEMSSVETVTPVALIQVVYERLNDHDVGSLAVFEAEDVAQTWPVVGRLEGLKAVQDHFAGIFAAMPDFHIDIERIAANAETVFVHWLAPDRHVHGVAVPGHRGNRPADRASGQQLVCHP